MSISRPHVKTEARFSFPGAFVYKLKTLGTGRPVMAGCDWEHPCARGLREEALLRVSPREMHKMKSKTFNNFLKKGARKGMQERETKENLLLHAPPKTLLVLVTGV
jgi:hypothetical protein